MNRQQLDPLLKPSQMWICRCAWTTLTIVDTIADAHYGDKVALAMAFAALLNDEAHELAKIGVDVIQFDEPARKSMETDPEKRKSLVWEIDRKLQEDGARPMIYHNRAATCWYPRVKGLTLMVNSIYNGSRWEDLWLDR